MREPKPIQRLEISEKNKTLRWIAAIALFIIGIVGITVGINYYTAFYWLICLGNQLGSYYD